MDRGRLLPVVLSFLIILNLPILETGASDGEVRGVIIEAGRENELVLNEIEIVAPPEYLKNDIYGNGLYPIAVNLSLSQEIMNVNVTVNVSHGGGWVNHTDNIGNMAAGDYECTANKLFDFTVPGLYSLNATVEGWLNGTGMVYGYKQLPPINFTTIIDFELDVTIQGSEAAGAYAKHPPLQIMCIVNFTGNVESTWTNMSVTVTNTSSLVEETDIFPAWIVIKDLMVGFPSNPIVFTWAPSMEGHASDYEISVTAINMSTGIIESFMEMVLVDNITIFGLVDMTCPDEIHPGLPFDVTVLLNNTGNVDGAVDVCFTIYEEGHSTNEVYNSTETSGNIDHFLMTPTEMVFSDILVDSGDFNIKVRVVSTGESIIRNLSSFCDSGLVLTNQSVSPELPLREGIEITFSVTYKGYYQGNVTLFMDDWPLEMVNASDDWDSGVEFTYTWVAETVGTHYYYFFAEDQVGRNNTLKNATDEPFSFNVPERTHGWVYGKVVDIDGNNVSGAEMVIYSTKLNETGATVPDEYFNVTADAYGCFVKWLPFSKFNYVIVVTKDWLRENDYYEAFPSSGTFLMNVTHRTIWWNTTLFIWARLRFNITGYVSPPDAVVKIGAVPIDVNITTGYFIIQRLSDGIYTLNFSADGYITQIINVILNDSDMDLGTIQLQQDPAYKEKIYNVTFGPLRDQNGEPVSGVVISFTLNGVYYMNVTGSDGVARFLLPVEKIPEGTDIVAWKDGWNPPPQPPGIPLPERGTEDEEKSYLLLYVSIIVVIFIVIIIILLWIKKRGKDDEEEEESIAQEEYKCPEVISIDITRTESYGTDFENDEMLFSVNENDGTEIHEKTTSTIKNANSISQHPRSVGK